ncbi:hypothetical protein BH23ACT11_BH23ACT11_23110 [soil metagenome]
MAAITSSPYRKILMVTVLALGCIATLLLGARLVSAQPVQQMVATWYGPGFEGNQTANGEVFDPSGYTAAHRTYDFDTKLIVTYEGRSVVVRINDRGPYVRGRDLDLAQGAAEYIGLTSVGVDTVDVQVTAASTPVGPYAPGNNNTTDDTGDKPNQNKPQRQPNNATETAADDQYVAEDQYALEAVPPPPAPKPKVPVLPPEPKPEELESPPAEFAVPNSTVEKRVEYLIAAEPAPEPVAQQEREEEPEPKEEPETELTVLPDTGGAPLSLPLAGSLLVAVGLSVRLLRR